MADHSKPSLTDLYTAWPQLLRDRSDDVAKWFDGVSPSNIPVWAKRWNPTLNQIENWNGTSWVAFNTIQVSGASADGTEGFVVRNGKPNIKFIDTTASAKSFRWSVDGNNILLEPDNGNSGATWQSNVFSVNDLGDTVIGRNLTVTNAATFVAPAVDDNSTRGVTSGWYVGQAASTNPLMNGTAAVGSSLRWARADHVHPSDSTKANLASPVFTGNPTAPTPLTADNSTSVATTAFVKAVTSAITVPVTSVAGRVGNITLTASDIGAGKFTGRVQTAGNPAVTIAGAGTNTSALCVESVASGAGAAFLEFHRPSQYAVAFGIDTDNVLKIGGMSAGGASYTIWHSGNLNPAAYVTSGSNVSFNSIVSAGSITINSGNYYCPVNTGYYSAGGAVGWYAADSSYFRINGATAGLYSPNGLLSGGNVIAYSDRRLKENVQPIEGALDKVGRISGVYFDWNDSVINQQTGSVGKHDVGVIAQEVQAVMPEVVVSTLDVHEGSGDILTVDYGKLTPLLIEAVKELKAELDVLREELKALKGG